MDNQDTSNQHVSGNELPNEQPTQVDWRTHIPQDMRDKGYWQPLKDADLSTVLKNYGHAQERLGRSITLPASEDDAEGWNKIYDKFRPESPDKYDVSPPEFEGFTWDNKALDGFKKAAHESGLSNKQVKNIMDWFSQDLQQKVETSKQRGFEEVALTETKLKKEYGQDYDMNVALAKRASNVYFGNETTEAWFDVMPEPIVRGLVKLGKQLAEDKVFGTNPPEMRGVTSKDQAKKKIAEIMSDRKHPYWSLQDTQEKRNALQEVHDLHMIAYPES